MDKQQLLDLAKRSPEIVGRHDKEEWINLFSSKAVVQDPVGAGPNRKGKGIRNGKDELTRFYDIFIAPNQISFTVNQDIALGNEVVRDVIIRVVMPNGAISEVPTLIKYSALEEDGELKIGGLNAHWDFTGNAKRLLMGNGLKGITASCLQFGNMIKVQGLPRVMQYCQAMYKGILRKGIKTAKEFEASVNTDDETRFKYLFDDNASIEFPIGKNISVDDFFQNEGRNMHIKFSQERSGGWFTSCVFHATVKEKSRHGVVFFEFNPETKKIISGRFFWDE